MLSYLRVPVEGAGEAAERLAEEALAQGLSGLYFAPTPKRRDDEGSEAWRADSPMIEALIAARATAPELAIWSELDLSAYHRSGRPGHELEGMIDLETAHEALGKAAITLGETGVDVIALRGLFDGGAGVLREALDEAGLDRIAILSFAADLYSPFAERRPVSANKAADLLDPLDPGAIARQAEVDASEGADFLGVQPCLFAQDILHKLADDHDIPVVARLTEHEIKMIENTARTGTADLSELAETVHGTLLRAGARLVVTPWAGLM